MVKRLAAWNVRMEAALEDGGAAEPKPIPLALMIPASAVAAAFWIWLFIALYGG